MSLSFFAIASVPQAMTSIIRARARLIYHVVSFISVDMLFLM